MIVAASVGTTGDMRNLWLLGVGVGALALAAAPRTVHACGGTFCDAGPTVMPVDQSGENILFVIEDGTVEAHVQIQYEGDAEAFAWLVPVMARPEIEAGSDALFQQLQLATVPTFRTNPVRPDCGMGDEPIGCADESAGFARSDADTDGGWGLGEFDDSDPTVVDRGVAGAFEYAVLDGGTVDGVVQWLDDNGYAQDDDAPDELQGYLSKGFLFVAFKLRGGTGTDEIHPVVIRYAGDEPCVPIRLTRIAATDDMGVRAFFLGEHRVAPTNYRDVQINLHAIDWVVPGSNYNAVVTQAVDSEESNGRGFVTEYAGPSSVVDGSALLDPRWDAERFRGASPEAAVSELSLQGLLSCVGERCVSNHVLLPGLLDRFLPRPTGVALEDYYGCITCYEGDLEAWDGDAFATELESRIIGPAEHAVDILDSHAYLTRLYTTLSPHEMTLDPIFHENPDLPDVSNVYEADMVFACEGPDYVEFDDGSRLAVAADPDPSQPAALAVREVPATGAPMTLVDNAELVVDVRRAWNAEQGLGGEQGCNCHARSRAGSGLLWSVFMVTLGWWARRPRRRAATATRR